MRAAWYERQGPPHEVLTVGELTDPRPDEGEVRIALRSSGINPGDVKKRSDAFGIGMPYPRVIPHSDGAGIVDAVGGGVTAVDVGDRVWCFGAQSYRPFGTAAEFVVVPVGSTSDLPADVSFEVGACLGIPGITAHRAVHVSGPVNGRHVLVQGGAGAVGTCAVAVARHAGAHVTATVRRKDQVHVALDAGADEVVCTEDKDQEAVVDELLKSSPDGFDHVVEVAFHANVFSDERVLRQGGSIAAFAGAPQPSVPFWPLVFKNITVHFLGSDDFPLEAKRSAARTLSEMLTAGWPGPTVGEVYDLDDIATAHESVESGPKRGRVTLSL